MTALISRFLGLCLVAGALVAAVIDGTKSIAASQVTITGVGRAWFDLSRTSLTAFQAVVRQDIETHVGSWVWDPVIQGFLSLPTWAALGGLGALLIWLSQPGYRRRRRPAMG